MKRKLTFFLLLALIAGCTRETPQEESLPAEEVSANEKLCEQGTAQLLFDDDLTAIVEESLSGGGYKATKSAQFNELVESLGIISLERVFPDAGEFEARHRAFGLHKWYRVSYNKVIPVTKAGEQALTIPGIEVWEPIRKTSNKVSYPFNDPSLSYQWHYYNDGTNGKKTGADINVLPVWNNYTKGDARVIVGVVDGGIDYNHEDLAGQVLTDRSKNFATGSIAISAESHGTHVGGTIAAINNNGKGVAGIAGGDAKLNNSGVKLISCQIFDGDRGGSGSEGIIWAADHGAVVCNNSWGLDYSDLPENERATKAKEDHNFFLQPNTYPYKHSLKDAVDYFNANAGMTDGEQTGPMAGGVVFFSAGNDPWEYGGYAAYPGVIAVGAIGPTGDRAYYSSYGDWVDLCAPGGDLNYGNSGGVLSTLPDNKYGTYQGTSMACPHVTGVAALVVSYHGKQGFTRQMLWDRLISSANTTIVPAGRKIGPLVDALGAITYGEDHTPDPVTGVTVDVHSNFADLSWKVTGDGTVPAHGYRLFYGPDKSAVQSSSPDKTQEGVTSLLKTVDNIKIGGTFTVNLENLDFETTYYGKVYGYDYSLNYSAPTAVFSFTTGINSAPVFTVDSDVDNIILHAYQSLQINFSVSDPEGHNFTLQHNPGSAAEKIVFSPNSGTGTLSIIGKEGALGKHTAVITATDSFGKSSSLNINYTIINEKPVVVKPIENMLFDDIGDEASLDLADYVSDPDGEVLTYTVSNTAPAVIHFNVSKGIMHITALGTGLAEVTVTGTDALGETVNFTFKALVRNSKSECQAYPNPVVNTLYISNAERNPVSMDILITSASGGKVYEGTLQVSAFDPVAIDFSGVAPGRYSASMSYNGNTYKQTVVKK